MLYLGIDQHATQITISLRDDTGTVVLNRQVSTEPTSCLAFLTKLRERAEGQGYVAIVEVCGFNDWLLDLLPKYGCVQTVLIQPDTKRKVKTDRRDAKALSESSQSSVANAYQNLSKQEGNRMGQGSGTTKL